MTGTKASVIELSQNEISAVSGGAGIRDMGEDLFITVLAHFLAPGPAPMALVLTTTISIAILARFVCGEDAAKGAIISGYATGAVSYFISQNGVSAFYIANSKTLASFVHCIAEKAYT